MRKRPAKRVLAHILDTPWLITEESLRTIVEIANRENPTPEAIAAQLGRPLDHTHQVTVRNGVATVPIEGPMFRHADLFTEISGATTYGQLATDLTVALNDPKVHAILLAIDSPGGEVTGLAELAKMIRAADAQKPVVAYVEGMAASAAYWLASAAREIVALDTALLGSIGARMTIVDQRERIAKTGVKVYDIVSSQSPAKVSDPATQEGYARIQRTIDSLAAVFISEVASHRGVSEAKVIADFGQGDVLVGSAAVTAGLADRLGTYEALHAELEVRGNAPPARTSRASASHQETVMEKPEGAAPAPPAAVVEPDQPVLAADVSSAELEATFPEQLAAIRTEAAAAERARVLAIQARSETGYEALIAECVNDPACTADAAAARLLDAQRAKRGAQVQGLADAERNLDAPPAQPNDGNDQPTARDTARGMVALHEQVSKRGAR